MADCLEEPAEYAAIMGSMTADLLFAVVLIMLSGLFSGLNLGLMSFAEEDLKIIISGSPDLQERKNAARILPLRRKGNLLLCTLLLGNTMVNAMIAILLAGMSSGVMGGLITTAAIVVFGEIIPQSVCSRHALAIGAKSVPLVWFFLVLCFIVAYPVSLILDKLLGKEISAVYTKHEMLELIKLNVDDPEHNIESGLQGEEGHMLKGALTYRDGKIKDVMTEFDSTYMVSIDALLDKKMVLEMLELGHTRMPVYKSSKENVVGILYAKDLVGLGFERKTPVSTVITTMKGEDRVHFVDVSETLGTANDLCREKCCHMLIVKEAGTTNKACGVITTEDILEEILQYEIVGDDDKFLDNNTHRKSSTQRSTRKIVQRENSKRYDPSAMVKGLV